MLAFVDVISVPTDNGTNTADPTAFSNPPIASIIAGDLLIVYAYKRTATGAISVSNSGGQSWSSIGTHNSSTAVLSSNLFWCKFNGTWSAAPSFSFGATANNNVVMLVFRSTIPGIGFALDPTTNTNVNVLTSVAANTIVTLNISTAIPVYQSMVAIAIWSADDDNTWGTLTGSTWTKVGLGAQYRNTSGQDTSSSFAYKILITPADLGNVSQTQATSDPTIVGVFAFYESMFLEPFKLNNYLFVKSTGLSVTEKIK